MLFDRGLVQLGAGEERVHDEVPEEVVGEPHQRPADLSQLQTDPVFELLVQSVDGVVFVNFQKTLQHSPPHIPSVFLLGLSKYLVKGVYLVLAGEQLPENVVALGLVGQEGNYLAYHI